MFNTQLEKTGLLSAGLACVGGSAGSGVAAAMATRWADKRPEEGEERKKEEKRRKSWPAGSPKVSLGPPPGGNPWF